MQAAHLLDHIVAGAQMQMIGVGQLDLAADVLEIKGAEPALDGRLGAHVHKHRCLHHAAVGAAELAPPGAALFFNDLKHG